MGTSRPAEVLTGSTDYYTVYTLIDITDSGVPSPKTDATGFYQAQNLNTFIQSIGIRSQPVLSSVEILSAKDLVDYEFGSSFTGVHDIWVLTFASETADAWKSVNNSVYMLKQDLNNTPIHTSLNETALITVDIIDTSSVLKNTYFKYRQNI
tara:strand:- start:74 stop:529 length:456 start_codon:yes stop_codon:yes gene_type:complete